jgi:Fungal protein kinase
VGLYPAVEWVSEARSRENTERQYEFEVHDNHDDPNDDSPDRKRIKKYRSVRCIANYGMTGIQSRGTSIYSVRALDTQDAPLQVLKDSWIEVDRIAEGRILEDIHTTLRSVPEYQSYLRHLLKPDYYGFVPNDAGMRVETIFCSRLANEPSSSHSIVLNGGHDRKRRLDWVQGGAPQDVAKGRGADVGRRGGARKRCRTVFVESPGKALGDLETLGTVFTAIKGGLNGAYFGIYNFGVLKCKVQLCWQCTVPAISIETSAQGILSSFHGRTINLDMVKMLVF